MRDPLEGVSASGTITTGAASGRVPSRFRPVLDDTISAVSSHRGDVSLYVYGSVATGQARLGHSDVDLLTIGLAPSDADEIGARVSARFQAICRSVEIGVATVSDFSGDSDEAYGGRVFLHHYCVHLAGTDHDTASTGFPADRRAARGFNGDIARHAHRWRAALAAGEDPSIVGRRIARKTLLAVAGLVSVHDGTWTTDRERGAERWADVHPELADGLGTLFTWTVDPGATTDTAASDLLDDTVEPIVTQFADRIGLWPD